MATFILMQGMGIELIPVALAFLTTVLLFSKTQKQTLTLSVNGPLKTKPISSS